jgi:hypothetical protein
MAYRERLLSRGVGIGFCMGNFLLYRVSAGLFARGSGTAFWPGMDVGTDEHAV